MGHLYLKKRFIGAVLVGASLAALYLVIPRMVERALQITERIQRGEVELDVVAITELLSRQAAGNESQLPDIAGAVIIISWLIGIVDSYRRGHTQDRWGLDR